MIYQNDGVKYQTIRQNPKKIVSFTEEKQNIFYQVEFSINGINKYLLIHHDWLNQTDVILFRSDEIIKKVLYKSDLKSIFYFDSIIKSFCMESKIHKIYPIQENK